MHAMTMWLIWLGMWQVKPTPKQHTNSSLASKDAGLSFAARHNAAHDRRSR